MSEPSRMEMWVKAMNEIARTSKADPEKAASESEKIVRDVLAYIGAKHLLAAWDKVERY